MLREKSPQQRVEYVVNLIREVHDELHNSDPEGRAREIIKLTQACCILELTDFSKE